jgi:hypothetical protein
MNKKGFFTVLILISLLVLPFVAHADSSPLDFSLDFDIISGAGGIVFYWGGNNPLQGMNIKVERVTATLGEDPFDMLDISNGKLNFTSGAHTTGWNWGSGGTITITGGIPDLDIPDDTVLMSGYFNSANVQGSGYTFKVTTSNFSDSKDKTLASYFGYGPDGWQGDFNISFKANGSEGNAFQSTKIYSGNVVNIPSVPIPSSVLLLVPGLAGLIAVRRRIKN